MRACQAGHRVAFATAAEWVDRLAAAHHTGRLQTELVRLGRYPLLVVDEVGYIPFEPEAAKPVLPTRLLPLRAGQPPSRATNPTSCGRRQHRHDRPICPYSTDTIFGRYSVAAIRSRVGEIK
jgi:hypothetical protein